MCHIFSGIIFLRNKNSFCENINIKEREGRRLRITTGADALSVNLLAFTYNHWCQSCQDLCWIFQERFWVLFMLLSRSCQLSLSTTAKRCIWCITYTPQSLIHGWPRKKTRLGFFFFEKRATRLGYICALLWSFMILDLHKNCWSVSLCLGFSFKDL